MSISQPSSSAKERGIALIMALIFTVIVVGIVSTGLLILLSHRNATNMAFGRDSQAVQIARSGLTEARSWLNRQTSQPVVRFEPLLISGATPPILDTLEPAIGLVRQFKVEGRKWARYEVWKEWDADPDPARLRRRQLWQCEDVSAARSASSEGASWRLRCVGYIYDNIDPTLAFNQRPNHIIAHQLMEVAVQRLILQFPGQAAVNVSDGNNCHINTRGRIFGGSTAAGIYYPKESGTPTTGPNDKARVTGSPPLSGTAINYDDSYEAVFSVPLSQLKAMATMVLPDLTNFPNPVPEGSLIIVEDNSITFNSSIPLRGNGVVILSGNVMLLPGNMSDFSGFLYIDGNFSMRAPSHIRGAVVCTGNLTLQGALDYATITYDGEVLALLRQSFSRYVLATSYRLPMNEDR